MTRKSPNLPAGIPANPARHVSNKRLLIMDDVVEFCDYVSDVATALGYKTEILNDPLAFEHAFERFQPQTVVLDMVMPGLDGGAIVQWLIERDAKVKLLIVTGFNPHHAKTAQLQSAAKGLADVKTFTKPISLAKLRAALA